MEALKSISCDIHSLSPQVIMFAINFVFICVLDKSEILASLIFKTVTGILKTERWKIGIEFSTELRSTVVPSRLICLFPHDHEFNFSDINLFQRLPRGLSTRICPHQQSQIFKRKSPFTKIQKGYNAYFK